MNQVVGLGCERASIFLLSRKCGKGLENAAGRASPRKGFFVVWDILSAVGVSGAFCFDLPFEVQMVFLSAGGKWKDA